MSSYPHLQGPVEGMNEDRLQILLLHRALVFSKRGT